MRAGPGFGTPGDEPVTTSSARTGELTGGKLLLASPTPPSVEGVGARYLAVTPPAGVDPVAILVKPSCPGTVSKYVGMSAEIAPHGFFAVLVDDPNDAAFLTPAEWGGTVFVTGVEITPSTSYDVQTETLGEVKSAVANATTWLWGDVNNDMIVNFFDVQLVIMAFQGNFTIATYTGADLALPIFLSCFSADRIINTNDTSAAIKAFQENAYPCPACPACP